MKSRHVPGPYRELPPLAEGQTPPLSSLRPFSNVTAATSLLPRREIKSGFLNSPMALGPGWTLPALPSSVAENPRAGGSGQIQSHL